MSSDLTHNRLFLKNQAGDTLTDAMARWAEYVIGPWSYEPDELLDMAPNGWPVYVWRHPEMGHLCGYALLPEGHPALKENTQTLDLRSAPEDITYVGDEIVAQPGFPGCIGFDCGHFQDVVPCLHLMNLWPVEPGTEVSGMSADSFFIHRYATFEEVLERAKALSVWASWYATVKQ